MRKHTFKWLVVLAAACLPLTPAHSQKVTFLQESDPFFIIIKLDQPETVVPSPDGNCVGSGCSDTKGGQPDFKDDFHPREVGNMDTPTRFRSGTFEVGPTWKNGGYNGESIAQALAGGDLGMLLRFGQATIPAYVTPDIYFAREQIINDLTTLELLHRAVGYSDVIQKFPQFNAPVPPSLAELSGLVDEVWSKTFRPLQLEGRISTDWDRWYRDLKDEALLRSTKIGVKRDLPLAEMYIFNLEAAVESISKKMKDTEGLIDERLKNNTETIQENSNTFRNFTATDREIAETLGKPIGNISPPHFSKSAPNEGEFSYRTMLTAARLANINRLSPTRGIAGAFAKIALSQASLDWSDGQIADAVAKLKIAEQLVDVALSILPISGIAKNLYESVSGVSFVDGSQLTIEQRALAGLSASISIKGITPAAYLHSLDSLEKYAPQTGWSLPMGVSNATPTSVRSSIRVKLSKLGNVGPVKNIQLAEEANAVALANMARQNRSGPFVPYATQPSWQPGSLVASVKLQSGAKMVRIHGSNNKLGQWLALPEDVAGLSSRQLKDKFNLPSAPEFVSALVVPKGTKILTGEVAGSAFGTSYGARQIFIVGKKAKEGWFTAPPVRLIP